MACNKLSITQDVGVSYLRPLARNVIYSGKAIPSSGGGTVINNQDITITENGVYTAGEGYTGIGTATVNVTPQLTTLNATTNGTYIPESPNVGYSSVVVNTPLADFVNAKNATGEAITSGEKVWIEKKQGEEFSLVPLLKERRFDVSGSVSVNDTTGIATNFYASTSNYLSRTQSFDFSKPWEFKTHVSTAAIASSQNDFIVAGNGTDFNGAANIGFWLRLTDHSFEVLFKGAPTLVSANTISEYTEYWISFGWTGEQYFAKYSTDGINYTDFTTPVLSTTPVTQTSSSFIMGRTLWFDASWKGSIFLKDTSLTINGNVVWEPYLEYTTPDTLTGFATENIAIDGYGEVKTTLPEQLNVSITADINDAIITVE